LSPDKNAADGNNQAHALQTHGWQALFARVLAKVQARFDERTSDGLVCKRGLYSGCAVLKLQKPSWTNDRMDRVENETGIFFSIWVNAKAASQKRAEYNIHALKLRRLAGYSITSRDFAQEFRSGFARMRDGWPNVSVDYGPLTLMQGWIEVAPDRAEQDILEQDILEQDILEQEILALMERFRLVSPLIDRLLQARRK
jgi:hypothetical protein